MNIQDKSPNRGGGRGNGSFRTNFRSKFGGGGPNNRTICTRSTTRNSAYDNNRSYSCSFPSSSGFSSVGFNSIWNSSNDTSDSPPNKYLRTMEFSNFRSPVTTDMWNDSTQITSTSELPPPKSNNQRTNDVEIIVTHQSLTDYAEYIERRLRVVNLNADILFPRFTVHLSKVMSTIASRGTLFALIVTEASKERLSVIVNVLYDEKQEPCNMLLNDAVSMILKNFDDYKKSDRTAVPFSGAAAGITPKEKHPEAIQSLLNDLIQNRPLNNSQYDRIISYLQQKKDRFFRNNGGSIRSSNSSNSTPENTRMVLQNRILSILAANDSKKNSQENSCSIRSSSQTSNPLSFNNSITLQSVHAIIQNKFIGSRI